MLALKAVIATILIPGSVGVAIPLLIALWVRMGHVELGPWRWLGMIAIIPGTLLALWTIWDFATIGKGTLVPSDPPKHLVIQGPYRFTRNPMYTGGLLAIVGQGVVFQSLAVIAYAALFFAVVTVVIRFYEEPALRATFGEEYERFCRKVPRWGIRLPQ
jgi:protein-S-isoprenylcysteine O-methyltransferase Ste14